MSITIVIPTYWGRPQGQPPQPNDAIFDHPTPVDGESTLPRLLNSLAQLEDGPPFNVLVLVAPVAASLTGAAQKRVEQIITQFADQLLVKQIGPTDLPRFQYAAEEVGMDAHVITLNNYAGARNMQLLASCALGSEIIIALDDDEIVPPTYLDLALETMGKEEISGAAGFYEDKNDSIYLPESPPTGNIFNDKPRIMNAGATKLLDTPGRWTPTPIAFGGNMLFRRELFTRVGFDSGITRGEDLDYVLNARLAGFTFWLDEKLRITHLPPNHYDTPPYLKLAEDVRRFIYQREKLRLSAGQMKNAPSPEDFTPYPGRFWQDDLEAQA